ncbi:MAG TPA: hypothetical protein VFR41_12915 [Acidimicrobiia bacterium]|nr:hypothetical protein [Acidimicrobiia bacterium]
MRRFAAAMIAASTAMAACGGGATTSDRAIPNAARPIARVRAVADVTEVGDKEQATSTGCGVERWSVKTGTDADRYKVSLTNVVDTSIATLRTKARPSSLPSTHRVAPVETTMWREYAYLVEYKKEDDSDIHLVLKNKAGQTMIAEIPSPSCVGSTSPFRSLIGATRSVFTSTYSVTTSWKTGRGRLIRLRGVGFFDYVHGQTGVAPNGIELHPVTGIRFP